MLAGLVVGRLKIGGRGEPWLRTVMILQSTKDEDVVCIEDVDV